MKHYTKILVALELSNGNDAVLLSKAQEFAAEGTELYLIHGVEHMSSYGAAYGISAGIDVEEVLVDESRKSLSKIAEQFNVPPNRQIVKVGPAKFLILEEAEKANIDLVIVGSHGRHGVRLLLGSTANAVLHGAKCDVLAVRVYD
ncbi:MAG: universal stress protein UspA [Coxiella sp. RIFCSPHIGHO2_12_FULL_44_14]|nr:MAG: universal stress protein UspA [Coxiella sp. RIFCSPHIGHO2_12_FULL_44_14]